MAPPAHLPRHAPLHCAEGDKIGPNCLLTADLRSVSSNMFKRRVDRGGAP